MAEKNELNLIKPMYEFLWLLVPVFLFVIWYGLQLRGPPLVLNGIPFHLSEVIVLSLPYRQAKWEQVRVQLEATRFQPFEITRFQATMGKHLEPRDYSALMVGKEFRDFVLQQPAMRGHLGATLSHVAVWRDLYDRYAHEPTAGSFLIVEDDVILSPLFSQLPNQVARLPADWDILLCGFSCDYEADQSCHQNDHARVHHGFMPVSYFIGMWGYLVRDLSVLQRLLTHIFPLEWAIDHHVSKLISRIPLRVYGCVPHLVCHPGDIVVSSCGYTSRQNLGRYYSDTNA